MAEKKTHLTPELRKEIVELTIETYNNEIENQRKKQFDRKLRNTRLLLEHYREFVALSKKAVGAGDAGGEYQEVSSKDNAHPRTRPKGA